MTIVKFNQHSGYTYYYTDWNGDMSGEYVPLAEYQEAINLVNELGEKDVQNRLQIDKLKVLIHLRAELGLNIFDLVWFDDYQTDTSPKLKQLLADCQEGVA